MRIVNHNDKLPSPWYSRHAVSYFLKEKGGSITADTKIAIPCFSSEQELVDWVNEIKEVSEDEGILEYLGLDEADFTLDSDSSFYDYYVLRLYLKDGEVLMDALEYGPYGLSSVFNYRISDFELLYPFMNLTSRIKTEFITDDTDPNICLCFHHSACDVIKDSPIDQNKLKPLFSPYWSLDSQDLLKMSGVMRCTAFLKMILSSKKDLASRVDSNEDCRYEVFAINEDDESKTIFCADNSDELVRSVYLYADVMLEKGLDNIHVDAWCEDSILDGFDVDSTILSKV